jgi:hypothetical protein
VFLPSILHLVVTANVFPSSLILFANIIEAISSSESPVSTRATLRHIPGDGILHSHSRVDHRSYKDFNICSCFFSLILHNLSVPLCIASTGYSCSLLLSFWTLSIVRISTNRKHNVSEAGSVSVFRRGGGHLLYRKKPKTCLSTGDARIKEGQPLETRGL